MSHAFSMLRYSNDPDDDNFDIAATETKRVVVYIKDLSAFRAVIKGTYVNGTSGTTGLSIVTKYGIGKVDPSLSIFGPPSLVGDPTSVPFAEVWVGDNSDTISSASYEISQGGPYTKYTWLAAADVKLINSAYYCMDITNNDTSNSINISIKVES